VLLEPQKLFEVVVKQSLAIHLLGSQLLSPCLVVKLVQVAAKSLERVGSIQLEQVASKLQVQPELEWSKQLEKRQA
jgi:hypothetical protein